MPTLYGFNNPLLFRSVHPVREKSKPVLPAHRLVLILLGNSLISGVLPVPVTPVDARRRRPSEDGFRLRPTHLHQTPRQDLTARVTAPSFCPSHGSPARLVASIGMR